jgi:hypothetical protein
VNRFLASLRLLCDDMEKERQLDGTMIDDLNNLVEHHELLNRSQEVRDSDSKPNTLDSPDAGQSSTGLIDVLGVWTPRRKKA